MHIIVGDLSKYSECESRILHGIEWLGGTHYPSTPWTDLPGRYTSWTPLGFIYREGHDLNKLAGRPARHIAGGDWLGGDIVWPSFRRPILGIRKGMEKPIEDFSAHLILRDACEPNLLHLPPWHKGPISHLIHPIRVGWGTDIVYTDESVRLLVDEQAACGATELCRWPVIKLPAAECPWAAQIVSWRGRALISNHAPKTAEILERLGFEVLRLELSLMELDGIGLLDATLKISA